MSDSVVTKCDSEYAKVSCDEVAVNQIDAGIILFVTNMAGGGPNVLFYYMHFVINAVCICLALNKTCNSVLRFKLSYFC